jgi:hypothetical protein
MAMASATAAIMQLPAPRLTIAALDMYGPLFTID